MNCYRCGKPLLNPGIRLRRKVKTGEWVRRKAKDGRAVQIQAHFGKRIVCTDCAKALDREFRIEELKQYGELVAAIVLILVALFLHFLS